MNNDDNSLKLDLKTGGSTNPPENVESQQEIPDVSLRYDALREADVNNMAFPSRPTLITLFGISECGKTTFVGSLFAILRRRPHLLNVTFIDSDTLTGFERRVHQRFLSETGQSVIQRTQRKAGSILNVVLGNAQGEDKHMFVLSDLSGEIYKDAISEKSVVLQQTAVKYADKLVIFVDIEALLKTKTYNSYKTNFKSLLTRFKENNMLPEESEIFLAFNKVDKVGALANQEAQNEEGEVDEAKKNEYIQVWKGRKKAVEDLIKEIVSIPDENIFEMCSLGIAVGEEDEGLIKLFSKILTKKQHKPLPAAYNWIQNVVKGD